MQDPERILKGMGLTFACPVDPSKAAILDRDHRVRLGHDLFYFSTPQAKAAFLKEPLRYCGTLTDPVSNLLFRPTQDTPRIEYEGETFYFMSEGTRKAFAKTPEKYRYPVRSM